MKECVFCQIGSREVDHDTWWQNEKFVAFLDLNPFTSGHTLVIPRKHEENLFAMEVGDYAEIFNIVRELERTLKEVTSAKRIGIIVSGFEIDHVHVHMIPLMHGGEFSDDRKPPITPEEGRVMVKALTDHLQGGA